MSPIECSIDDIGSRIVTMRDELRDQVQAGSERLSDARGLTRLVQGSVLPQVHSSVVVVAAAACTVASRCCCRLCAAVDFAFGGGDAGGGSDVGAFFVYGYNVMVVRSSGAFTLIQGTAAMGMPTCPRC